MYCEASEPLTSVSIRRRSVTVRGESVVTEGIREMNSGINLYVFLSNGDLSLKQVTLPKFH